MSVVRVTILPLLLGAAVVSAEEQQCSNTIEIDYSLTPSQMKDPNALKDKFYEQGFAQEKDSQEFQDLAEFLGMNQQPDQSNGGRLTFTKDQAFCNGAYQYNRVKNGITEYCISDNLNLKREGALDATSVLHELQHRSLMAKDTWKAMQGCLQNQTYDGYYYGGEYSRTLQIPGKKEVGAMIFGDWYPGIPCDADVNCYLDESTKRVSPKSWAGDGHSLSRPTLSPWCWNSMYLLLCGQYTPAMQPEMINHGDEDPSNDEKGNPDHLFKLCNSACENTIGWCNRLDPLCVKAKVLIEQNNDPDGLNVDAYSFWNKEYCGRWSSNMEAGKNGVEERDVKRWFLTQPAGTSGVAGYDEGGFCLPLEGVSTVAPSLLVLLGACVFALWRS
jgi:hypothetical protein